MKSIQQKIKHDIVNYLNFDQDISEWLNFKTNFFLNENLYFKLQNNVCVNFKWNIYDIYKKMIIP